MKRVWIILLACFPLLAVAGNWISVPGSLTQVSAVSATNVWGVNMNGNIWHWNGSQWAQVPGFLANVSAASDGTVWGVTPEGKLFSWSGSTWNLIDRPIAVLRAGGAPLWLGAVAVGSRTQIWAMGTTGVGKNLASDKIYTWDAKSRDWIADPDVSTHGPWSSVSVDAQGDVWATTVKGAIWRRLAGQTAWATVPGNLVRVSAGSPQYIVGVNANGAISRWRGTAWEPMTGSLKSVSVTSDGEVWGAHTSGGVFHAPYLGP